MIRTHREEMLLILFSNLFAYKEGSMSFKMAHYEFDRFVKYHIEELSKEEFGAACVSFQGLYQPDFQKGIEEELAKWFEKQKVQRPEPLDFLSVTG